MSEFEEQDQQLVFSKAAQFQESESFQDVMRDWLKQAPWFAVSIVIHAVIALVLINIPWLTLNTDENKIIQASYDPDEVEPLTEEEIEEEEEKIEEIEEVIEDPEVTDELIEEELIEEDQTPIDAPFDGMSVNVLMGIGGGAGGRFGGKYRKRGAGKGGGRATQKAVEWGLDWLKRHQDPEGFWDADEYHYQCTDTSCDGKGHCLNDVGVTGLAMLAFLGAGNTITEGPYKKVVKKGAKYLCDVQHPDDGCLVTKEGMHWMYNHAIGTLALTEAYGLSRWMPLKKRAQKALDFIHQTKNPGKAWRYHNGEIDPVDQNDVSVTGWMIMCLASAKDFNLRYDKQDMRDALLYIDEMTDSATGRTGYKERGSYSSRESGMETVWPFEETEAMTAVAMLSRVFAGIVLDEMDKQVPTLEAGAALLRNKVPDWSEEKGRIDYYYWYYGSYAMYQMGGKDWKIWKTAMEKAVVENQRKDEGCNRGSWDPKNDPWGHSGGRVYSTALLTLCLEVFYRYDNVLGSR